MLIRLPFLYLWENERNKFGLDNGSKSHNLRQLIEARWVSKDYFDLNTMESLKRREKLFEESVEIFRKIIEFLLSLF